MLQFEAGLALTNLASIEGTRNVVYEKKGWRRSLELVYSQNPMVQRAGLELLCNLATETFVVRSFVEQVPGEGPVWRVCA